MIQMVNVLILYELMNGPYHMQLLWLVIKQ